MSSLENNTMSEKHYWRSSAELEGSKEFEKFHHREFQEGASELEDGVTRRNFLKLMGASIAFATASGCAIRKPVQKIRPYAQMPEHVTVGKSVYYATSFSYGEEVVGLLAESSEGRPTKLEGNPLHPESLGKTNHIQQASVLDLYDPDRLQSVLKSGKPVEASEVSAVFSGISSQLKKSNGSQVAVLMETSVSQTDHRLLSVLQSKFPGVSIYRYDGVNRDTITQGLYSVTGQYVSPRYNFETADVVVSFDADFLGASVSNVRHVNEYAKRRDPDESKMNRLYAFEQSFSVTGAKADHRFKLKTSEVEKVVWKVASRIISTVGGAVSADMKNKLAQAAKLNVSVEDSVVSAIVKDVLSSKGKSILLAGPSQPESVHGLLFIVNQLLNNNGKTIQYPALPFASSDSVRKSSLDSIKELAAKVKKGAVKTVVALGGNPLYAAPSDLNLKEAFKSVNLVHVSTHMNDTAKLANVVIPRSHYLEAWSDAVALDGTKSIVQPLIKRLYDSYTDAEVIARLLGSSKSDYTLVRDTFRSNGLESKWKKWLHDGVVSIGKSSSVPSLQDNGFSAALNDSIKKSKSSDSDSLEVSFKPSYALYDGRFSNNGWLQELPDPITKLTWDNAAYVSPKTAKSLKLKTNDLVTVTVGKNKVESVVFVLPGHAENSLTLTLGYGHSSFGRIGEGKGFDVTPLRTATSFSYAQGVSLVKKKGSYELASTQNHGSMEGRPHYREADLQYYKHNKDFAKDNGEYHPPLKSLFHERPYDTGYQWGMAIDLTKCVGCNACLVACQSENNIPIVGKEEVLNGREMHWIRIDRYFEGDEDNPRVVDQPVTCLHCENAPCEQVCPVAATVHSEEGTNDMAYNRCIGTRYCSDNCPVKVRRFNFFDYHQRNPQSVKKDRFHIFDYMKEPAKTVQMQFNSDVTVRMRGVMEKCTYCIQRVNKVRKQTANENRLIQDGEVVVACEQACPADAIAFGNILDENSKVAKLKKKQRDYHILEQLHLKPRTSYLASVRNPNPSLVKLEKGKRAA
jgi:molybdopterin-containing oxidoreductase family iron-sulfur binding subunit